MAEKHGNVPKQLNLLSTKTADDQIYVCKISVLFIIYQEFTALKANSVPYFFDYTRGPKGPEPLT